MEKFCAILSGGEFSQPEGIQNADFVIACDRGYAYAKRLGIVPDLFIGDFDSLAESLPESVPALDLPCEKDDTDTMAAVRYAVGKGRRQIVLYCALGGRLDHLLGNLQAAAYAVRQGARVEIRDESNRIWLLQNGKLTLPPLPGYSLSLLAVSDTCKNVSVRGVKYPLEEATLTNSFPIGVSNEWRGDAQIRVGEGVLMVICSKMSEAAEETPQSR